MVLQTTTQISRPLPPSRPIPPTPPRGTIYVVERFGRFSRLLPGNGPPLLPLVDRVIAAYARRVDQATAPEGILALLPTNKRVIVNAKWSIRVADARKLAYRITDVDRCIDMLVHVRIRDTFSTVPPTTDLDDPAVLKRISDVIRVGIDATAARFGAACSQFKVLSARSAEEKPQRSLNLADVSPMPDYYSNGVETVLPELPGEAEHAGMQSFSSLPSLPPPNAINYPQPIAYPQPPQPPRRPPALASVRLPPPRPSPTSADGDVQISDDDSIAQLQDPPIVQRHTQSFGELPDSTSPEHEPTEGEGVRRMYTRSQSLPQLLVSEDEALDPMQPSSDLEEQSPRGLQFSEDEVVEEKPVKSISSIQADEKELRALPVSDDEVITPVPQLPTHSEVQELPRDNSSLTDENPSPPVPQKPVPLKPVPLKPVPQKLVPQKREVLYAPPPSPALSSMSTKSSCVLPELLSNALTTDVRNPTLALTQTPGSPPPEKRSTLPEQKSTPPEQKSTLPEQISPTQEQRSPSPGPRPPLPERGSPAPERRSPSPERRSPSPERRSPSPERKSPPPKQTSPPPVPMLPPAEEAPPLLEQLPPLPQSVSPPPECASPPTEGVSPPPERVTPLSERVSPPPEHVSSPPQRVLLPPERITPPSERVLPPSERVSPPPECVSPPSELVPSPLEQTSPPTEQVSPLKEKSALVLERTGSPIPEEKASPLQFSSGGLSPSLATIFADVTPTPQSELPASERSSDSPSDSHSAPLAPSPASISGDPKDAVLSQELVSESSDSYKDAMDEQNPAALMPASTLNSADAGEQVGQGSQASHAVQARSIQQAPQTSQELRTAASFPVRAGVPVLGPSMIPMPAGAVKAPQPVTPAADAQRLVQPPGPGMTPQIRSFGSMPPRAPTPPRVSHSVSAREASSRHFPSSSQHRAKVKWQNNSAVTAEGLASNPADPNRQLPVGVGNTHTAEVGSRAKHAISRMDQPLYEHETNNRGVEHVGSNYSPIEALHGEDVGSESDDTNTAMRGKTWNSPPLKREPRKRRQHVQTTSLFSSVVGKAERAIKSAGASLASDRIDGPMRMTQTPATTTHNTASPAHAASSGGQMDVSNVGPLPKQGTIRHGAHMSEIEERHHMPGMPVVEEMDQKALLDREAQRRGQEHDRDEVRLRRDGKSVRTTEEEENLSRREHARRERLMDELDKIQRRNSAGVESSDDDSTRMLIDGGSDEERERFNDETMSESGAHLRRRREKSRHRRRHTRREAYDMNDSSSDEACVDCGRHHHHHDGDEYHSSHRRGRSKSRSKRVDDHQYERSDYDSEPRSVSRSRSGRERKGTSELSVDSHRSGKGSSRDRHRNKKSSSRDRKIEKSSSSTRSRSRDGKRSHSKGRSSSKKRDGEDRKRKDSKSKSKSRNKREGPTPEQLEYKSRKTEVKSIYRHRLPESDSGPENPIPWYCEGQSEPEDTDLDDYHAQDSSDSDDKRRPRVVSKGYSSYGRRDRYGRRHRAQHNRSVTFLYDNR